MLISCGPMSWTSAFFTTEGVDLGWTDDILLGQQ